MIQGAHFDVMDETDLDWVVENERQLHAFPWSHGNFVDSLASGQIARVMRLDRVRVAYAIMLIVLDEAHLLNISVVKSMQGRGVGTAFLSYLFEESRRHGAVHLFLEVRPSNETALELYRRIGFIPIGRRKRYYPAANGAREDAIVMRVNL